MSGTVGVERIFPIESPNIDSIEVNKVGKVRRAKLYYLRKLTGKAARIKEKRRAITVEKEMQIEVPEKEPFLFVISVGTVLTVQCFLEAVPVLEACQ